MLFKKFNLINRYNRLISKHKNILLLLHNTNNVKGCSTTVNDSKKKPYTFDGPSLKDFITKDFRAEQNEFVNNEDKIPYVDTINLGQNRKGK